jgi:CHAT domain-containing protein/Tfp pilus assembly protein PilF
MIGRGAWCAWLLLMSLMTMSKTAAQETPVQEAARLQAAAEARLLEGRYNDGIEIARRAIALREQSLGSEHADVAVSLQTLAELQGKAGKFALAESSCQRFLSIREKISGPDHQDTAKALVCLGDVYFRTGEQADPLYQRALAIFEKTLGPEHLETSRALVGLAKIHTQSAAYERAESLYERALSIQERVGDAGSLDAAATLNSFGVMCIRTGAHARAKTLLSRSLAIRETVLGPEHPDTAVSTGNLALLYTDTGDYVEAEAMLKRTLAVMGLDHPGAPRMLGYLANLYTNTGAYDQAEPLYRQVISIQEKLPEPAATAVSLNNLAHMYSEMGRPEKAEPLLQQALAIWEKSLGSDHPFTMAAVGNLGNAYRLLGAYDKAEPLYKRAIATSEATQDADSRDTGDFIYGLANLYFDSGAAARARPLYQRAIAIYEKTLGPDHPETARALRSLAAIHWARGATQQALSLLQRVQRMQTRNADRLLSAGSEARKQSYLQSLTENTSGDVSFALWASGPAATALGLTSVLQHKGRVLDAVSDNMARLRRSLAPADQGLLEQLADIAAQLSLLTYGQGGNLPPEQYRAKLAQLAVRQEQLQGELASRSRSFSREVTPVTLANVQRQIPANAVLVEWFRYTPFDPKHAPESRRGAARYVAYLLKRSGEPIAVDVGEAQEVEAVVRRLRVALATPTSTEVKQQSAAVSAKLLTPLRVHLRGVEHILFSPDGELNLVPMAALQEESGTYLSERFNVSYLTSGRDLLRIATDPNTPTNVVVIADPDYGKRSTASASVPGLPAQRSADLDRGGLIFRSLAGTALEAKDLKTVLKLDPANLLLRQDASESKLKALKSPRILHIASHGFFLSDQQLTSEMGKRRGSSSARLPSSENPLLRSGIALAGANQRSSGEDDGILTALEATQLDLSGTELVVLSACDSGVGEVHNGEGVYGLRRALALAGAQTQVTSLWKVSDDATRHLMVDYYRRLQAGEGRAAALRSTQRAMLTSSTFSHPYYWASFIPIGNWTSLPAMQ